MFILGMHMPKGCPRGSTGFLRHRNNIHGVPNVSRNEPEGSNKKKEKKTTTIYFFALRGDQGAAEASFLEYDSTKAEHFSKKTSKWKP